MAKREDSNASLWGKTMSAFMIVEIMVRNQTVYAEYMREIPAVITRYNGTYRVRSSKVTPVSGGWVPDRLIVVEFETLAQLRSCFASPEYKALAPLREESTVTRSIVVED